MAKTSDRAALDEWYAVETAAGLTEDAVRTRLLGQDIELSRRQIGDVVIREIHSGLADGPLLPVQEKYGCIWTTLGHPNKGIFEIAEAAEADRRFGTTMVAG